MTNSGLTDNGEAFVPETLYSENYRDHTIEIRTALDRRSALVYEGFIDSDKEPIIRKYNSGRNVDAMVKSVRHYLDVSIADALIRPFARLAVGTFSYVEGVPTVENPKVGEEVCGSAFGRMRRGIVEKVKRTGTVVVAYVTPSNPLEVRRMTLKPNHIFDPRFMRQIG